MRSTWGLAVCAVIVTACGLAAADETAVAVVNGHQITQDDLDIAYLIRRIPAEQRDRFRESVMNDLIDRALIADFLDQRKAPVPESELHAQLELLKTAVAAGGTSLDDVLAGLGLTAESLRSQLALPLRWKAFVRRTVTDQQLRDYFAAHRAQFDDTKVHVRQIVIAIPPDADDSVWSAADEKLRGVRTSIVDGELSFEDAARRHSTSPSGKQGGDVGFVTFHGQLPAEVTHAAFALQPMDVSEVIRSAFGVHLVQAVERKPGDYSLEDVREEVWERRTREFWDEQVAELRSSARIETAPQR